MTDSEKLEELRKAFKLAVLCACDGDTETLNAIFPCETSKETIEELEAYLKTLGDDLALEDYFKHRMEL